MAEPSRDQKPTENIFRIMDEIVHHLNKTKRMFVLMIILIVIALPVTHVITFAFLGDGPFRDDGFPRDRFGPPDDPGFRIVQAVVAGIVVVAIGIGIRQWLVLSKWTKKYERYKKLQKKIDDKLDYDDGDDNTSNDNSQTGGKS